jgi:hypothetical protein
MKRSLGSSAPPGQGDFARSVPRVALRFTRGYRPLPRWGRRQWKGPLSGMATTALEEYEVEYEWGYGAQTLAVDFVVDVG